MSEDSRAIAQACTAKILDELSDAHFSWEEYPTLIDASEHHVTTALMTPNRTHRDLTAAGA